MDCTIFTSFNKLAGCDKFPIKTTLSYPCFLSPDYPSAGLYIAQHCCNMLLLAVYLVYTKKIVVISLPQKALSSTNNKGNPKYFCYETIDDDHCFRLC